MSEMDQQKNAPIRQALGRMIGVLIIVGAIVVSIIAVWEWQVNPETDDATVRANFIGVAPQVNGPIVELHVRDNQLVQAGDLLFVIDPRPYEIAVERARAALVLTRREVEGLWNALSSAKAGVGKAGAQVGAMSADITRAEAQRVAARAALTRAEGEFTQADDHLKRLEPLLPRQFVTARSSGAGADDAAHHVDGRRAGAHLLTRGGGGGRGRPSPTQRGAGRARAVQERPGAGAGCHRARW